MYNIIQQHLELVSFNQKSFEANITAAPVSTCAFISSSISICLLTIWGEFIHLFTNGALRTFLAHTYSLIEKSQIHYYLDCLL